MQEAPDLVAALATARAVACRASTASDAELLADLDAVEQLGRIVDGLRIRTAAEVERRSRKGLGEESLAFRSGERLVDRVAAGSREAGCEWLHVDFEPHLEAFYRDRCGFRGTAAGLLRLAAP